MVISLPNPFSKNCPKQLKAMDNEVVIEGDNVLLVCEFCYEETNRGIYDKDNERLKFECVNGHLNIVNIDLSDRIE